MHESVEDRYARQRELLQRRELQAGRAGEGRGTQQACPGRRGMADWVWAFRKEAADWGWHAGVRVQGPATTAAGAAAATVTLPLPCTSPCASPHPRSSYWCMSAILQHPTLRPPPRLCRQGDMSFLELLPCRAHCLAPAARVHSISRCDPLNPQGDVFFYVLLPVIMFDAGFGLDTRMWVAERDSEFTTVYICGQKWQLLGRSVPRGLARQRGIRHEGRHTGPVAETDVDGSDGRRGTAWGRGCWSQGCLVKTGVGLSGRCGARVGSSGAWPALL